MTGPYRIVFSGNIVEGFSVESVKASFVTQFKVASSQIDRLFSGTPVTIRRNLDRGQAEKIRQAILKVGGIAEIVAEGDTLPPPKRWMQSDDDGSHTEPGTVNPMHRDYDPLPDIGNPDAGKPKPWSDSQTIPLAEMESPEYADQPDDASLPNVFDDAAYRRRQTQIKQKVVKTRVGSPRFPFIGCLAILALVAAFLIFRGIQGRGIQHGPGVVAPDDPIQHALRDKGSFEHNGFTFYPKAEFDVTARVLSVKHYKSGSESVLSPTDLALGWGRMSDESILQDIKITQSGRFYYWRVKEFPIPRKEIESHSANMHMIPSNEDIADRLKTVKKGHVISFSGKLVFIKGSGGWYWNSSLTRNDTGMGACEVIWLEDFQVQE